MNIKPLNHLDQQNTGNPQILPLQGEMEASLALQDPLSKNVLPVAASGFSLLKEGGRVCANAVFKVVLYNKIQNCTSVSVLKTWPHTDKGFGQALNFVNYGESFDFTSFFEVIFKVMVLLCH